MSLWSDTDTETYAHLFTQARAPPPGDLTTSTTLPDRSTPGQGLKTKIIKRFNPAALTYDLGPATLDLAFVNEVLRTTGPLIPPQDAGTWIFDRPSRSMLNYARTEQDFYPWLNWLLCSPAAHAVNAVRDKLYQAANMEVPVDAFPGESRTDEFRKMSAPYATDIIHWWHSSTPGEAQPTVKRCTPHEFKRAKVLHTNSQPTLDYLVECAGAASGHKFRISGDYSSPQEKSKRVLCQTINEMTATQTGHSIICTQEQYVLLRLTDDLQLEVSRVYHTRDSTTQATDMAELVLFYTLSALGVGKTYSSGTPTSNSNPLTALTAITAMRFTVPAFPAAIFQPYEGVFRTGGLNQHTPLIPLPKAPRTLFPLPWLRFDGAIQSDIRGNDVTISHGSIFFFFLAARVVAKTAYGLSAATRLHREYNAYAAMHSLQGAVIPRVVGLYKCKDENSMVLLITYAGRPLETFGNLPLNDRRTLFQRLLRLHESGIQHNDFEPRNVTMFGASNPIIIDFDNASVDHACTRLSCGELLEAAEVLELNIAAELSVSNEKLKTTRSLHLIIGTVLCFLLSLVRVPRRR